jgi:hypothetical protein
MLDRIKNLKQEFETGLKETISQESLKEFENSFL